MEKPIAHVLDIPGELARLIKQGAVLLDVRTKIEAWIHPVPGAKNISLSKLKGHLTELPRGKTIVTFCRSGRRGNEAKHLLEANGFEAVNGGGYKAILKTLEHK